MKRPMIFLLSPLVLGILIQSNINLDISYLLIGLGLLALLSLFIEEKNTYIVTLTLIALLIGALCYTYRLRTSTISMNIGREFIFDGKIHSIEKYEKDYSTYIFKIKKINNKKNKEKVILKYSASNHFKIGDELKLRAEISPGKINTNPRLFNEDRHLKSKGIFGVLKIKEENVIDLKSTNKSLKRRTIDYMESSLDKNLLDRNSNLMKSIVLGKSDYLEEDLASYRQLGLSHILAVSGLHIGIIASVFLFILVNIGLNRQIVYFIILGFVFFYGYILDFPPSVLRGTLMLLIYYISLVIYEPYDGINSLFLVAVLLILYNPFIIYSVGFQLSFMATFSIFYIPKRIKRYFKKTSGLKDLIILLISITIGTLPLQVYYFNRLTLLGIASNLLVTPVISMALNLVVIGLIVGLVSRTLLALFFYIANNLLLFQFKIVDILSVIKFKELKLPSLNILEIVLVYILIFILLNIDDFKKIDFKIKKLIGYSLIFILIYFPIYENNLILDFIDVGQGDSILIRNRGRNYLIDTGGSFFKDGNIVKYTTIPYLEKEGVFMIDGLFISHYHEDHCEGLPYLLEEFKLGTVFIAHKNSEYFNIIESKNVDYRVLSKGDRFKIKDLEFLILSGDNSQENENNNSLVVNLNYRGFNFLFTGDIEEATEKTIIDQVKGVDLLKVPHHGSNTSSSEDLLRRLTPKTAIISVGRNNMYGHPSEEVLKRYKDLGTDVYRTDQLGRIRVRIKNNRLLVSSYLDRSFEEIFKYIFIYAIYMYILYLYILDYKSLLRSW